MPRKKVKKSTTGTIEPNNKSYLDIDEVTRLEQVAGNLRDRLLIRLLSRLGCRISEELGIEVDNINFSEALSLFNILKPA